MYREGETEIVDLNEIRNKRKGTISCCMITRDEEEYIECAIRSVRGLADEVIVVDTGSLDRTVTIARRCGAKVYEIEWNNDFSEARNFSIAKATKEWILILDADEAIARKDHKSIRKLIARYPNGAFLFDQWTYTDASATFGWNSINGETEMSRGALGYFCNQQIRLFRNESFIRYRGEVHENVEADLSAAGIKIFRVDVVVHHYGRLKPSDRIHRKSKMYLSLGKSKLEDNPKNTRYLMEMATQLLDLGHVDEAVDHAERGLEIEPYNWELLNILGLARLKEGQKSKAELCFHRALEHEKNIPDLYNNLGVTLMEQKSYSAALENFEKGIELSRDSANLLRNAASACLSLQRIEEASGYILRSLEIDPFMPQSHIIHADLLFRKGDYEGSVQTLKRIRFLPGTPLKVYLKAIHIYNQMKMVDEAEEILQRAMEEYPEYEGLFYLSGKIFEMKEDYDKAISSYKRFLSMQPGNPDIYNSLGCIYEKQGDLERALTNFLEALQLSPDNLQIEVNLGIVMGRMGINDEAERHLRSVIEKNGDFGIAYNALGCHLASQSRYRESLFYFTHAVELEPGNINYYLNLGLACEKMNMPGKAAEVYEKIAFIDPQSVPLVRTRLEKLRQTVY